MPSVPDEYCWRYFDEAPVGLAMTDEKFKLIKVNSAFCRILGYTWEELQRLSFDELSCRKYINREEDKAEKLAKGELSKYIVENEYIRKDGKAIWLAITVSVIRDAHGQFLNFLCIVEDVTTLRKEEELLCMHMDRYRDIFANAPFGIFHSTVAGQLIDVNDALVKMLGYSSTEELLDCANAKGLAECVYAKPRMRAKLMKEVFAHEGWQQYENLFRRKDGQTLIGYFRIRRMPEDDMTGAELEGFVEDISERKRAEQELQLYQDKLRVLSSRLAFVDEKERQRLANNIHDYIGQELSCAMLQLRALEKEPALSDGARGNLQAVRKHIEQGIQYARSVTFELSPAVLYKLGFEAVVEWLADLMEEQYGLPCDITSDEPWKITDTEIRVVLFRAVREMLINAVKHAKASHVQIDIRHNNNLLEIYVADNGIGFDVANSFRKTKSFGLFSVREQLAYVGGSMSIDSRIGKGTTVKIIVPIERKGVHNR